MPPVARKYVAEIGAELALPFARDYCRRWGIAHDAAAGEGMWWAGAFMAGGLRAVLGLATVPDGSMIVSGIFTDTSEVAEDAAKMLIDRVVVLPCPMFATFHLPSERLRRALARRGWRLNQGVI